jgi:hypothetical protein
MSSDLEPGDSVKTTERWSSRYGMNLSGTVERVGHLGHILSGRTVRIHLEQPYRGFHQVWLRPGDLEKAEL